MKENVKLLAVRRADCYSPQSVEKDRNILNAVCDELKKMASLDEDIVMIDESDLNSSSINADVIISMARSEEALSKLEMLEKSGVMVVNSPAGVRECHRSELDRLMQENDIPMPPDRGKFGYWLKRGDAAAQSHDDVVFCADVKSLKEAKRAFAERGITKMVVSAHMPGDLIKFYGVGSNFFRYFYPTDDGVFKFDDEVRNGESHHYPFDEAKFKEEVDRLAKLTGIEVFGGDAIIDRSGSFYIIDFNDWPSFSRCVDDAAKAIAVLVSPK